mmetsp:Transcript_857/g.2656  ORF Transcript_857/g.2656 Transcript_857/m.2656 type:complete len:266 (+) Transcript_857:87-884(+)
MDSYAAGSHTRNLPSEKRPSCCSRHLYRRQRTTRRLVSPGPRSDGRIAQRGEDPAGVPERKQSARQPPRWRHLAPRPLGHPLSSYCGAAPPAGRSPLRARCGPPQRGAAPSSAAGATPPKLALPYAARVVLRPRNNRVAVIIEGSREDLVGMPLEHLQVFAVVHVPHAARPVTRGCDDLVALRVERDLGDFALVPDQDGLACAGHRVVHARCTVCRRRHQLGARRVEGHVQDLVVVPAKRVDALARRHVPDLARPVDGARYAQLA